MGTEKEGPKKVRLSKMKKKTILLELLQRYGRYNVYLSIGLTRRGKLIIITPHHPLSCTAGPRLRRPRVAPGVVLVLLRKEGGGGGHIYIYIKI